MCGTRWVTMKSLNLTTDQTHEWRGGWRRRPETCGKRALKRNEIGWRWREQGFQMSFKDSAGWGLMVRELQLASTACGSAHHFSYWLLINGICCYEHFAGIVFSVSGTTDQSSFGTSSESLWLHPRWRRASSGRTHLLLLSPRSSPPQRTMDLHRKKQDPIKTLCGLPSGLVLGVSVSLEMLVATNMEFSIL